jgi:hypothetical protein
MESLYSENLMGNLLLKVANEDLVLVLELNLKLHKVIALVFYDEDFLLWKF